MAHTLSIPANISKREKYEILLPQLDSLIEGERDLIANSANISAVLKEGFAFFWVGFYFVKGDELVLGPFQGSVACTRIRYGKGVCGSSWKEARTIIVPDVDQFPGHIACSSASRSEIVVPVYDKEKKIIGVLDIDSDYLNMFDEIDAFYLEKVVSLLINI